MNNGKVLIAAKVDPILLKALQSRGYSFILKEEITRAESLIILKDCVGIITSTKLLLDKELLSAAPLLKWIGRMGSGMEIVDTEFAATHNIQCYSSPEGNCNAVGEHALGMLLNLIRKIATSRDEMMKGFWKREENRGYELEGKTIAIIGFGHTGSAFAKKLMGFDMKILTYDKKELLHKSPLIVHCNSLEPIYNDADIISFHVPYTAETNHFFNNELLLKMEKPFILINTSRGKVVDTFALMNGLTSGKIVGACLDVFETEPPSKMDTELKNVFDKMIKMHNVVVTPHIAGYTYEAIYKMSNVLVEKIFA